MAPEPTDEPIARVQQELADSGEDVLVLSKGINQYYLSGFFTAEQKRHLFLFIPAEREPFYFAPEPYRQDLEASSTVETIYYWDDTQNPVARLHETIQEVGLDDADEVLINETMWGMYVVDLQKVFDANFASGTSLLMKLRTRKSESELENMREAARITDAVSEEVRSLDAVGMTENELAAEIEYRVRKHGAGDRGSTQVASGPNSAKPPHTYSNRTIEAGDPVVIDFGCSVDGYLSDNARVVVYGGDPPEGYLDAYETVRKAQEAAIDAIEPGVKAYEIDEIARSIIDDAGYEGQFLHVTGHGLGLGIHEPPYLMSGEYMEGGNKLELEPGMVFTVEPGIYNDWGIRIEDEVVVTEDGCERIINSDHGWEPL